MFAPMETIELIETLWNVNITATTARIGTSIRINRNIVECKCLYTSVSRFSSFELIETLWNVNSLTVLSAFLTLCELIETLWNVNAESPKEGTIVNGINRNIVECK